MSLTDIQIIKKYKIKSTDKILDIGGSMKQHQQIQVDTLVDLIYPNQSKFNKSDLLAKKFVQLDLNKDKFPFKDKEFDFCLCSHTLEDLNYPFLAISEMARVSKRGYITTPSFGSDITFTHFNLTDWKTGSRRVPGISHHKWLFYIKDGIMQVLPKNYPILYSSRFHFTKWLGEEEFEFYWMDKIKYREVLDLDFSKLISEYKYFVNKYNSKLQKGLVAIYIDNPFFYFKEVVKSLLGK